MSHTLTHVDPTNAIPNSGLPASSRAAFDARQAAGQGGGGGAQQGAQQGGGGLGGSFFQPIAPGSPTSGTLPQSLTDFQNLAPILQASNPTLALDPKAASFGNDRSDPVNALAGFFQGDPFQFAGKGVGIGAGLNFSLAEAISGGFRGQERRGLLEQLIGLGDRSSQLRGSEFLANASQNLVAPGNLDRRFDALGREATERSGASLNTARNRLSDLGVGGAGGAPALLGAEFGASRDLQDTLLQLDNLKAQEGRSNLGAASQGFSASEALRQSTQVDPRLQLAGELLGPENRQNQQLTDNLFGAGQLEIASALAEQGGSFLEEGGLQFIGGLLKAAIGAGG